MYKHTIILKEKTTFEAKTLRVIGNDVAKLYTNIPYIVKFPGLILSLSPKLKAVNYSNSYTVLKLT